MLKNCKTKSISYADDLVITATNQFDLQLAVYRLGNYCNVNKLEVNVQKTKLQCVFVLDRTVRIQVRLVICF